VSSGSNGQGAKAILQGGLRMDLLALGQLLEGHVVFDVQLRILHPSRTCGVLDHTLTKPRVFEEAIFNALTQVGVLDTGLERPHPHNHHQVAGRVHAQPGGVDLGHPLSTQAQHACRGAGCVFSDRSDGFFGRVGRCNSGHHIVSILIRVQTLVLRYGLNVR
jgi:hypothetical protein